MYPLRVILIIGFLPADRWILAAVYRHGFHHVGDVVLGVHVNETGRAQPEQGQK